MENIILNAYFNYIKNDKQIKYLWKTICSLPKPLIFILVAFIINVVFGIYSFFNLNNQINLLVSFAIQIILIIIITIYGEYNDRITSKKKLLENLDNANLTYRFLKSISITSKENIIELKSRINVIKEKREIYLEKSNNRLRHWIQIIFVPTFLLVVSKIIQDGKEFDVIIYKLIVVIFFTVTFLSLIILLHMLINKQTTGYIYRINTFSNALQGVLDTYFDDGLLYFYHQDINNKK